MRCVGGDLDEELGAEQWTAGELVFLKLSIRVKV
jgi:hypothetical protein